MGRLGLGPSSSSGGGGGGGMNLTAALSGGEEEERWRRFDSSVSAVSFGFVATAILISMFLVMAIFERFFRHRSPLLPTDASGRNGAATGFRRRSYSAYSRKLDFPSPKMSIYTKGVSVLMPGNSIPTFIAQPVPAPCPPERITWPSHDPKPCGASAQLSS